MAVGALGVRDMVEHGVDGFLCENDAKCLIEKALLLLQNRDLMDTMRSNALYNAEKFSNKKTCVDLLNCYQTVQKSTRPGK